MRYDNIIQFTYQRYVIKKTTSIYVRYANKMTTNTLSELYLQVQVVWYPCSPSLLFLWSLRVCLALLVVNISSPARFSIHTFKRALVWVQLYNIYGWYIYSRRFGLMSVLIMESSKAYTEKVYFFCISRSTSSNSATYIVTWTYHGCRHVLFTRS